MPKRNGQTKAGTRESGSALAELERKFKALERRVAILEAKLTNATLPGAVKPLRMSLPPAEGDTSEDMEAEEGEIDES